VSPTRGAQGNALKTIVAMGRALDGTYGETIIESRGVSHQIEFSTDPDRLTPTVGTARSPSPASTGTSIKLRWPNAENTKVILDEAAVRFLQVAENYTWFNPQLSLRLTWNRDEVVRDDREDDGEPTFVERTEPLSLNITATDSTWKKWRPSDPTSPHWYGLDQLARLIAANIAYAEDTETPCPTVLAFIREFRGLSSTGRAKAICDGVGAERQSLATFYGDGKDHSRIELLLAKMREASRPVKRAAICCRIRIWILPRRSKCAPHHHGCELGSLNRS
jgi:hypothetical protein